MKMRGLRRFIGVLILLVSLALLAWGLWPASLETRRMPLSPQDMGAPQAQSLVLPLADMPAATAAIASPDQPPVIQSEIPEERLLILEWPEKIRLGESGFVRLTLEMNPDGRLAVTAATEGGQVSTELLQIENLYDTHQVIAEARLEMAGMDYRPNGPASETMQPGRPVRFIWSLHPLEVGDYQGTVWLHLRLVPLQGGPETRTVLTAQLIAIDVVNFLGLGGSAARVMGSVGFVLGSMLSSDLLVALFSFFFKRNSKTGK